MRRVGSGEDIRIELDPWLPDKENPYISTHTEAVKDMPVSSLMITGTREWDRDLIIDVFNVRDAQVILNIPFNNSGSDRWFWCQEKLGLYSVRSAYGFLRNSNVTNLPTDISNTWRRTWNLKVPAKMKIFLWRAISNILPTKDQLRMKKSRC